MPARFIIGIGTIKNLQQAQEYFAVGADFLSVPTVPEVGRFFKSKGILYSPGCMTPTEIIEAENTFILSNFSRQHARPDS
jgi:2-dehydro-3-deoxyphosphogluconate aldolase/(4S)-4-hydroxy-2-oxoglutarate aldolase